VVSTSILRVVWKEFSEAKELGDELRIRKIYSKISKIIIISTTLLIGFIIPWSLEIIRVTVGEEYLGMEYVLIFIWFYPLFQNIGQLDAILLNSTNVTKPNVIIGTVFIVLNLIMSVLLLMPNSIVSELSAARNIALKMVVLQCIQTYVRNKFICKKYSLNNNFFMIFKYMALFLCAGCISKYIAVTVNEFEIYLSVLLYITIFLLIIGSSIYNFKNYFHLTEEIMFIRAKFKNF
jgi:O-antigen/teichoic acid export membrane protein